MLYSKARWNISEPDPAVADRLAHELKVEPVVARLLAVRGITTIEQAKRFLQAGKDHFHDPFLMDGMETAVRRIKRALEHGEFIRIYGDYDADGVSSTSLLIHLFRRLGARFDFYIPHRVHEGYGLNKKAMELAKEQGVDLIITVDTGISAREEIAYAGTLGLEVIVTDHHEPPEQLPDALAVLNPKKPGCPYPFKQLAGAGVAFKLAHALLGELPVELLEIATIGTVADLMPLQDENRALVKLGLERMRTTAYPGIKSLLSLCGVDRGEVTAGHIGFGLGPRINASGRLEGAEDAVRLLTVQDEQEAERLAFVLDGLNKERQQLVTDMTGEAVKLAEESIAEGHDKVLVVAKEDWNVGVIGIVASKLLEKYYRPVIVLGINPETGMAKGSARSIPGFDLYQALTRCNELFTHYGGHQAAAGMSLHADNLAEFRERMQRLASEWLTEEDYQPVLNVDLQCELDKDPMKWIRQLEKLAPFGMGNPTPKFAFHGLRVLDRKVMGKEQQHIKFQLAHQTEDGCTIDALGFGKSFLSERISPTSRVDVLGELSINEWNGSKKSQLIIQDIRVPDVQVFDWRGIQDPDNRWKAWREQEGAAVSRVLLVFSEGDQRQPMRLADSIGARLWMAEEDGSIVSLEPGDPAAEPGAVRDLVLYSLPRSIGQLEAVLGSLGGVERIYAVFREYPSADQSILPTRDMFKQVYAVVRQENTYRGSREDPLNYFSKRSGLSRPLVKFIMEVFEELSLVEYTGTDYRCVPAPAKKEFTQSERFRQRQRLQEVEQQLIYSSAAELTRLLLQSVPKTH